MGGRGYGGGGRGRLYTYRYTVTTRTTCIKMGSDESHFNVSLIVRDKVTRPCPQTTTSEEKGEPKRYRTEVHPLTSLTPYRLAKPANKVAIVNVYVIIISSIANTQISISLLCFLYLFVEFMTTMYEYNFV